MLSLCATIAIASAEPPKQTALTNFSKLKDGDLVFIESTSIRAPAIKALTGFDLTHCGIVFQSKGKWIVYEGAGRPEDYSELAQWILRESGGVKSNALYARRLTNRESRLVPKLGDLEKKARELHDTSYDFGFAWTNRDKNNREFIYCSELIWKAFHDVVKVDLKQPHPLADYIEHPPTGQTSADVKKALHTYLNSAESKKRRNDHPYEASEKAISPKEVFESSELDAVTD